MPPTALMAWPLMAWQAGPNPVCVRQKGAASNPDDMVTADCNKIGQPKPLWVLLKRSNKMQVWHGMVWHGMVWHGVAWCGMVHGVV